MTGKTKSENLTDADLEAAKGGVWGGAISKNPSASVKEASGRDFVSSREGAERYIGETEKNIVATSGNGEI